MFRAEHAGLYTSWREPTTQWLMIAALALLALRIFGGGGELSSRSSNLALIVHAPAVFVGVNVLLRLTRNHLPFALPTSISLAQGGTNQVARLLGIHLTRVAFPLSLSVNAMGVVAAAGFAGATVYAMRSRAARPAAIVSAIVCLWGLFASDSRGPLLYSLAVILLFIVWRRVRAAAGIGVLIPLTPVLAIAILGFLGSSGLVNALSRQSGDIATGNNRFLIWHAIFNLVKHPSVDQLYGFGVYGQLQSGVVYQYTYLFGNTLTPIYEHAHNLVLQTLLDFGYIGVIALVALVTQAIRALERQSRSAFPSTALAMLALLLVLVLSGTTEAYPSYFSLDTLAIFVLALSAAVIGEAQSPPAPEVSVGHATASETGPDTRSGTY
jgi:O-antigen ligase